MMEEFSSLSKKTHDTKYIARPEAQEAKCALSEVITLKPVWAKMMGNGEVMEGPGLASDPPNKGASLVLGVVFGRCTFTGHPGVPPDTDMAGGTAGVRGKSGTSVMAGTTVLAVV